MSFCLRQDNVFNQTRHLPNTPLPTIAGSPQHDRFLSFCRSRPSIEFVSRCMPCLYWARLSVRLAGTLAGYGT